MTNVLLVSSSTNETPESKVKAHTSAIVQGKTILALRKKKGWSREKLAHESNCSVHAVAKYEREHCTLSFDRFSVMLTLLVCEKDAKEIEHIFMNLNQVLAKNIL